MKKDRINTTIDLVILILFTVSCFFLSFQLYLGSFFPMIVQVFILIVLVALLISFFVWILISKKYIWLRRVLMITLSILIFSLSSFLQEKRSEIIHENTIMTDYRIGLYTYGQKDEILANQTIGVLVSDSNHVNYFKDMNEAFGIENCDIKEYHSIYNLIKALRLHDIGGVLASDRNLENIETFMHTSLTKISENFHEVSISHNMNQELNEQGYTILFSYSNNQDPAHYVTKTDLCFFLFFDPVNKEMKYVEIPTNIYIPNIAFDSYPDALYNLSYNGIDNLIYSMESVFGFNIDYFIKFNDDAISNVVDIMQGIDIDFSCEEENCVVSKKHLNGEEALDYFKTTHDFKNLMKGFFDKKNELVTSKLVNFINVFKRYCFTNMSMDQLRTTIALTNKDSWSFVSQDLQECEIHMLPLISSDFQLDGNVAVMNERFLNDVYRCYLDMKHIEIMKNFAFDLNQIHDDQILPDYNKKTIIQENMDQMIQDYFNLFPELSINPVEVEKWQGTINYDKPTFDPDGVICPIE